MADIRSFFSSNQKKLQQQKKKSADEMKFDKSTKNTLKGPGKKRKLLVIASDSDEEPLPAKFRKEKCLKKEITSDEVILVKEVPTKNSNSHATSAKKPKVQELLEKFQRNELQPTTAEVFFASVTSAQSSKEKKEISSINSCGELSTNKIEIKKPINSQSVASKLSHIKENSLRNVEDKYDVPENKMKEAVNKYLNTEVFKSDNSKNSKQKMPLNTITPPNKKMKDDQIESKSAETSTPVEKKKNYWAYKLRDGPAALGSKELPKGAEDCLSGLSFVITGILEAFEREDVVDAIKRYGGKVTTGVSGKTSYIIVGRDPGETKLEKAVKHKTKQIDEDDFIELIKSHSKDLIDKKTDSKSATIPKLKEVAFSKSPMRTPDLLSKSPIPTKKEVAAFTIHSSQANTKLSLSAYNSTAISEGIQSPKNGTKLSQSSPAISATPQTQSPNLISPSCTAGKSLLWVDKYKPATMRNIVGQQGDKSNANKLYKWLLKWKENNSPGGKNKKIYSGKEDGFIFKAALLSGPPGVGKTTTANLVCQELGFSFIEMNASDTRGKTALDTIIKDALSNKTVAGVMQGNSEEKHALIMDEVDGMAGTEDRGGIQELIQLIKKTKIPIICMCNDRNHPKVRSLSNYCFDLRFYKPRIEQIKGFAMSVAAREGFKIQPQAMEQIVIGANQDIRQVLHNLQMWNSTSSVLNYDDAKKNSNDSSKNIKLGPFDIVKQLYTANDCSKMSFNDITDLFFMDYSFIPLFMQENYLCVNPAKANGNPHITLELISEAADSFSDSDLVDCLIRKEQSWSLLPLQGLFSTVIPSVKMAGYIGQRIDFPRWLGKNSSTNKHHRILQELKMHMSLSARCVKSDINTDYIPALKQRLTGPLLDLSLDASAAAKLVISAMNEYNLLREDWDSIIDICKWGDEPDISSKIPAKVKSAFTRLYNKESHKTPYTVHQIAKRIKGAGQDNFLEDEEDLENVENVENDEEESDDITKDAMILIKKEPVVKASGKGKSAKTATSATGKKKPAATKGKSRK